jgi:predicted ATP-binding protein involved in virulence
VSWIITLPYYIALRYAIQLYGAVFGKGSASKFVRSHSVKDIIASLITAYASAFKGGPLIIKKRRTIKRKISIREFEEIIKKNKINAGKLALID